MPLKAAPITNSVKLLVTIATVASPAPVMPIVLPSRKPARRPKRCMSSDAGMLVSILASICIANGRVASALSGASRYPTSAEVAISSEPPVMSMAWLAASSSTFRFMLVMR